MINIIKLVKKLLVVEMVYQRVLIEVKLVADLLVGYI